MGWKLGAEEYHYPYKKVEGTSAKLQTVSYFA